MEGRDREDFEGGNEARSFSNWEKQCIEQLETQEDVEERLEIEKEQALQRLRNLFQNAATACAQLYKGWCFFFLFKAFLDVFQARARQSFP